MVSRQTKTKTCCWRFRCRFEPNWGLEAVVGFLSCWMTSRLFATSTDTHQSVAKLVDHVAMASTRSSWRTLAQMGESYTAPSFGISKRHQCCGQFRRHLNFWCDRFGTHILPSFRDLDATGERPQSSHERSLACCVMVHVF